MERRGTSGLGKVGVIFSLCVVCGTAQGMLENIKKNSMQLLLNHTGSLITFGVGSFVGAGITKLFSKTDDDIPPAPDLDLKNEKLESRFLQVSEKKVRQVLMIKETDTIPRNWFAQQLISKNPPKGKKGSGQPNMSNELELKHYKLKLKKYLGSSFAPQPSDLIAALRKKHHYSIKEEKKKVNWQLSKLKIGMMDLFDDTSKKTPDDLVEYVKGQLSLKYQLKNQIDQKEK